MGDRKQPAACVNQGDFSLREGIESHCRRNQYTSLGNRSRLALIQGDPGQVGHRSEDRVENDRQGIPCQFRGITGVLERERTDAGTHQGLDEAPATERLAHVTGDRPDIGSSPAFDLKLQMGPGIAEQLDAVDPDDPGHEFDDAAGPRQIIGTPAADLESRVFGRKLFNLAYLEGKSFVNFNLRGNSQVLRDLDATLDVQGIAATPRRITVR